jgi:hypothetical protein
LFERGIEEEVDKLVHVLDGEEARAFGCFKDKFKPFICLLVVDKLASSYIFSLDQAGVNFGTVLNDIFESFLGDVAQVHFILDMALFPHYVQLPVVDILV